MLKIICPLLSQKTIRIFSLVDCHSQLSEYTEVQPVLLVLGPSSESVMIYNCFKNPDILGAFFNILVILLNLIRYFIVVHFN